jgi:hypothetical protein
MKIWIFKENTVDKPFLKKPFAFISANPNASFEEFYEATGSSKQQFYDSRSRLKKFGKKLRFRQISEQTKFIVNNPNAKFEEYEAKFPGSTRKNYTASRANGVAYFKQRGVENVIKVLKTRTQNQNKTFKHKEASEFLRVEHPKIQIPTEEILKQSSHNFEVPKQEITSLGITPEFIWYESGLIRNGLTSAMAENLHRFDRVVRVMEERHAEHLKMLKDVMSENGDLRIRNRELNEMLDRYTSPKDKNGSSV